MLADADHLLDAESVHELADLPVIGVGLPTELRHLAEHGDAPVAPAPLDEMLERRAHRDRVRVVAVVEQETATREWPLLVAELRKLDRKLVRRGHAQPSRNCQRDSRVVELMARLETRRERKNGVPCDPLDHDVVTGEIGLEQRLLVGNDHNPARTKRVDQLGFCTRDVLDGVDQLEMDRPDVRDHGDVRLRERCQPGDLAQPAHPHLGDQELRLAFEPAQCERHADLVVEVALVRDRPAARRTEREEDVLRRGLAGRAGDGDDAGG